MKRSKAIHWSAVAETPYYRGAGGPTLDSYALTRLNSTEPNEPGHRSSRMGLRGERPCRCVERCAWSFHRG